METKHLTYFKVENFKRFDTLEVKDIGQFNLVVGDNNVGKTTLLEALLLDDENYSQFQNNLWCILEWKNIRLKNTKFNWLFFFLNENENPIAYSYSFDSTKHKLSIKTKLKSELSKDDLEKIATQILLNGPAQNLLQFNLDDKQSEFIFVSDVTKDGEGYVPFISFNMIYRDDLVDFFSEASIETNKLKRLETDLKSFIPSLDSIEINNALIPQQPVIAIRETNKNLIPLSQYGDGTIKLFRYLLALEKCENKRLLIDEIDTGIHYSRMKDFLKKVLQSAKNKNVQIFATTHSKECIEYYKQALEELNMQDDGRIIRIANTKSGIKAYTLNYKQFENALEAESEIR